jgi:hypothetical protein
VGSQKVLATMSAHFVFLPLSLIGWIMRRKTSVGIPLSVFLFFSNLCVFFEVSCSFSLPTTHVLMSRRAHQFSTTVFKAAASDDTSAVSDAEALHACWSYLKRRKTLGNWTKFERRNAMKALAKPHYFWEDEDDEVEIVTDDDDDDDPEYDVEAWSPGPEKWFGEFTSFPTEPTVTRSRRSRAAKKTWQDPEFRKRWQQSRWGGKRSKEEEEERLEENRVRSLPREFWGSPELAQMTEEEIATAIETYVSARNKRSASRKKTLQEMKPAMQSEKTEKRLPRDALFTLDQETLKEKQRLRSERAKKAYQNRMRNKQEAPPPKRTHRRAFLPTGAIPQDALLRIEDDLDRGEFPLINDVFVIMKPLKLAKRKDLLKRILLELFDLRGKCVPVDLEECDCEKSFVTQCSIQHLGDYVVHLLQTQKSQEQGKK